MPRVKRRPRHSGWRALRSPLVVGGGGAVGDARCHKYVHTSLSKRHKSFCFSTCYIDLLQHSLWGTHKVRAPRPTPSKRFLAKLSSQPCPRCESVPRTQVTSLVLLPAQPERRRKGPERMTKRAQQLPTAPAANGATPRGPKRRRTLQKSIATPRQRRPRRSRSAQHHLYIELLTDS